MPPQAGALDDLEWQPSGPPPAQERASDSSTQMRVTTQPSGQPLIEAVRPSSRDLKDLEWTPPKPEMPSVSTGGAAGIGLLNAATFGATSALSGAADAGAVVTKRAMEKLGLSPEDEAYMPAPLEALIGTGALLHNWVRGHNDPEVQATYERGRARMEEIDQAAQEQHKPAYYAGMIGGMLGMPLLGPEITAARLAAFAPRVAAAVPKLIGPAARTAESAVQGGIQGGLQSTGESISRGETPAEIATHGIKGTAMGTAIGGPFGAVFGRRTQVAPGLTRGQRAIETAKSLPGEPDLPVGVGSDSWFVHGLTAASKAVPFASGRIGSKVSRVAEAAKERIGEISRGMGRGAADKTEAGTRVSEGLQDIINANHAEIKANYDKLRSMLPAGGEAEGGSMHAMPHLTQALDEVTKRRLRRGKSTGDLEQFELVKNGMAFNDAQAVRTDARLPSQEMKQHKGYDARDWKQIERAITKDLEAMVQEGAIGTANDPQKALRAFKEADAKFGPLADQNEKLQQLINYGGKEGAEKLLNRLTSKADAKSGDLKTLSELKQSMPAEKFAQLGSTILRDIGLRSTAEGKQFSLRGFASDWDNLSKGAKNILFDPAHRRHIDDIVEMTRHIGGALKEENVSKTANSYITFELMKLAFEVGPMVAAGFYDPTTVKYEGLGTAAAVGVGLLLGNKARAASTRSLLAANTAYRLGPTPARSAMLNIAVRNTAHTFGVPVERVQQIVQDQNQAAPSQQAEVPRR